MVLVKSEVCEGTFFETEIEFETISLSKPEIEARIFSSFLSHFEEKTRNSSDF